VFRGDDFYIADKNGVEIDVSHDFRRAVFPGEPALVRGTRIVIEVPFEGDRNLWDVRPSTFGGGYPEIDIRGDVVQITIQFSDDTADQERLRKQIDDVVNRLTEVVGHLRRDVDNHNAQVPDRIKQAIERKREKAMRSMLSLALAFR
jgi:hypothetical protein